MLPQHYFVNITVMSVLCEYYGNVRKSATFWKMHSDGPFSRTTWVSQYQKGRTSLEFNEARDDGVAVASAAPYANRLHFAPGATFSKLPRKILW